MLWWKCGVLSIAVGIRFIPDLDHSMESAAPFLLWSPFMPDFLSILMLFCPVLNLSVVHRFCFPSCLMILFFFCHD